MRGVRVSRHGGPEVLEVVEVETPVAGRGQLLVDVTASGVNFIDIYFREGRYKRAVPFVLGQEGAGRVAAVGDGVDEFCAGDRVAWKAAQGSYAEQAVVNAAEAVAIPDGVSDETAAAVILQGVTAHYLVTSAYPIAAGETALVHAAAGGVGLLLTQMIKLRGGRVIGTVSSAEKAQLASETGADEIVRYDHQDVAAAVKELTDGKGVPVVYDGVGATTFDSSLACLRPRGYLVVYGASSGPVPPVDIMRLHDAGSVFLTRPTIAHYTLTRAELLSRSNDVFGWLAEGRLRVHIGGRYPLDRAAAAHRDLAARRTAGKLLILPRNSG